MIFWYHAWISDGKLLRSAVGKLEVAFIGLFDSKYIGFSYCNIDGNSVGKLLINLLGIIVRISLDNIYSLILG